MTAVLAALRRWAPFRVVGFFLLGLVLLDVVVHSHRQAWRRYDPDDYRERVQGCRGGEYDFVLVGGSPVCEGINPTYLTGLSWKGRPLRNYYSLSLPGGTTTDVWHAVKYGLTKTPRLLVYGISASDVNDARNEPHGVRTIVGLEDLPRFVSYRRGSAYWGLKHYLYGRLECAWKLYEYRNGIRLWASDWLDRHFPDCCPESAAEARQGLEFGQAMAEGHGYAPRPGIQANRLSQYKAAGLDHPQFGVGVALEKFRLGEHLRYLNDLLDWAEQRKVDVVLVDMPVSEDLESRVYPQAFAAYRRALEEIVAARHLTELRPTRADAGLTDEDFADLIHLNDIGNPKFSAWLRRALEDFNRSEEAGAIARTAGINPAARTSGGGG